uniref:Uncharacterized protein n=1 Tax=Setaria italica TaxID=4555 RepID=K4APF0_SETIT
MSILAEVFHLLNFSMSNSPLENTGLYSSYFKI